MNKEIEMILSIIPQSYYDFIAKIIPGLVALEISSYIYYKTLLTPNNIWEVIFGIVAIYILGLILDIAGLAFSKTLDFILFCCYIFKDSKYSEDKNIYITIRDLHNGLHGIANNQNANIIIKMLSEIVLLRSLSLIFLVIFFAHIPLPISIYQLGENQKYLSLGIAVILYFLRLFLQCETALRITSMLNSNSLNIENS